MVEIGIKDEEFVRGNAPMTKQEVRILSLVKARIHSRDVIYDIGAGSGSIAIEAARLTPDGYVYAVERNQEAAELIHQNAEKFEIENLEVLETEAPVGLEHLPMANVVFVGGSGGHLREILTGVDFRLKPGGRIILNCITAQSLMAAISYLREHEDEYDYEVVQIQATRWERVGRYDMAKAMNPVFIVTCTKRQEARKED